MTDESFGAWLRRTTDQNDALQAKLLADCGTPDGLRGMRACALIEYRCRSRGCLLLLVWQTPDGTMFYQPGYTLSPGFNAGNSTAAGRSANTVDGERHWRAQAGALDGRYRGLPNGGGLELNCPHVSRLVSGDVLLDLAEAATPGRPSRRVV